jgi:hypothetical protein
VVRVLRTPAERRLWGCLTTGRELDLSSGDPARDAVDRAGEWGPGRRVDAGTLAAVLRTATSGVRLRIRGARVTGRLDLSYAQLTVPVQFVGCGFDAGVDLVQARTRTVDLLGCAAPYLDVDSAEIDGHLRIMGSRLGWLGAYGARITGHVELSGSRLSQPGGTAVNGDYLSVARAVYCHDATVEGTVRLPHARVGGTFELSGSHLLEAGGWALFAEFLTVGGDLRCHSGFRAEGAVHLASAQVAGFLLLGGDAPAEHIGPGGSRTPRGPGVLAGVVDLSGAVVGGLRDDPAGWPTELRLDGLRYADLAPQLPAAARLRWLALDRSGYQPQPYEQLAAQYRKVGHEEDARRVLLVKQRRLRATLGPAGRVWGLVQDATVGYGYRPWLAGVWLVVLLAVGTAFFVAQPPAGAGAAFDAFDAAVGAVFPVGGRDRDRSWTLTALQQAVYYLLTAGGWVLATALVSGVARRLTRS